MKVEELFRKLSYGELRNHSWAVEGTGTIKREKHNEILHHVNEGLKALHLRFPLAQDEQILVMTGADLVVPAYGPNTIQVLSILTAWGESLPFGTKPVPGTLFVYNGELHIPARPVGSELQVTFQMRHPELRPIVADADLAQDITLLPELHKALTTYVAAAVYGNMLTPEALQASLMYQTRYEQACLEAQVRGLIPEESLPCQKFEQRGFV